MTLPALSQETSYSLKWTAESHRINDTSYELKFSTRVSGGWELYGPDQELLGVQMSGLSFPDSSVRMEGDFLFNPSPESVYSPLFETTGVHVYRDTTVTWIAQVNFTGDVPAQLQGTLLYSIGKDDSFYPSQPFSFTVSLEGGRASTIRIRVPGLDINHPVSDCGDEDTRGKSLFTIFLLGMLGGLIALLTPCVFPMIPVTVTFFTKKSQDQKGGAGNAILYGAFIFLIYVLITLPFHLADKAISPEIFNNISTNVWLNLVFFVIFVVFALSFFGLFEIGLPPALANRAGAKSGLGNLGGIFFMAATLAIVSFSCTGPILGTLLVGVADQGAWPLTAGAAGFGLALGLPFALFALFPRWLHSLPKSGGWMTDVKVVLGFLELALAVKFLSNADLVQQWGILKREVFIGLWILIGIMIVLYLLGVLRMAHASPVKRFSVTRIFFIVLFSAATLYLVPGLTNTKWSDMRLISGFPPPRTYSLYHEAKRQASEPGVFEPIHNDYERALALAKKENKPVLIDFTGWACVNCRRMEEKVWPDPVVDSLMRNQFIVVSLYVDERRNLPVSEQTVVTTSSGQEKSIVTVGDRWATFQTENFGATSQPQYAIITGDEKALTRTKYYTPDPEEFIQWLQCGLNAYDQAAGKK